MEQLQTVRVDEGDLGEIQDKSRSRSQQVFRAEVTKLGDPLPAQLALEVQHDGAVNLSRSEYSQHDADEPEQ